MPWIYCDENGRMSKFPKDSSEVSVEKLLKENEQLKRELDLKSKSLVIWIKRAQKKLEETLKAEHILDKFEAWWRLPDDKRTIPQIEDAMADAIDFLRKIEKEREEYTF